MSGVGKIVVCIALQGNKFITIGTAYEVEQDVAFHYTVKNDRGVSTRYSKECFEETPKKVDKPPICLTPRNIYWEELNYHRRQDIIAAMQRRMEAKMDIPVEWCKELIDLVIADSEGEI
jgi:hypothetical protein